MMKNKFSYENISKEDIKVVGIDIDYDKLISIIEEWKNTKPSDKQIKALEELGITDFEGINKIRALTLIEDLNKKKKLTEEQIDFLKKNITLEEINQIINEEPKIESYEQLTNYEFKKISKSIKFSFNNIIVNYIPKRLNIPLIYSFDHEVGISQERSGLSNYIYYIKFYELLILDFDHISYEEVIKRLNPLNKLLFRIYKTFNGYHAFCVSDKISYNSEEAINISRIAECDPWYIVYFKYHAYCIRISAKHNRIEEKVHTFVGEFGEGKINENLKKLVEYFENIENDLPDFSLENYQPKEIKILD